MDGISPSLDVTGPGRGCNAGMGAFYLHELESNSSRAVTKFALDYSYNCGGAIPVLRGAIRYNSSVPSVLQRVFAVAGPDMTVSEGRRFVLDASRSWSPASKIANVRWSQDSGPVIDLSQCNQLKCSTYSPLMPNGGGVARLRVTVETESGLTDSDTMQVAIVSNSDRATMIEVWGKGFVSGSDYSMGTTGTAFGVLDRLSTGSVYQNQTAERLDIQFAGPTSAGSVASADVALMNKRGSPLVAGTFYDPGSGGGFEAFDNIASVVMTNVAGGASCGGQIGRMIISDIDRDTSNYSTINSLSAFIQTNCVVMGITELESNYARILINHLPTNIPTPSIDGANTVQAGGTISLSSANSTSVRASDTRVWRIIYGPAVDSFTTPNGGSTAQIRIPSGTPVGTKFVVSLSIIDVAGEQGTALFAFTVN